MATVARKARASKRFHDAPNPADLPDDFSPDSIARQAALYSGGSKGAQLAVWECAYGQLYREALEIRRKLDLAERALASAHREMDLMATDNPLW